ncbi:hypothetical protein SDC9_145421 [bioreactor metagenome]|uniref:Uncharacterized protein n=1 Tax=bioreactor metagenome TaxID=1076179 RepID=A0A645E8L1_9ZZZZ
MAAFRIVFFPVTLIGERIPAVDQQLRFPVQEAFDEMPAARNGGPHGGNHLLPGGDAEAEAFGAEVESIACRPA